MAGVVHVRYFWGYAWRAYLCIGFLALFVACTLPGSYPHSIGLRKPFENEAVRYSRNFGIYLVIAFSPLGEKSMGASAKKGGVDSRLFPSQS